MSSKGPFGTYILIPVFNPRHSLLLAPKLITYIYERRNKKEESQEKIVQLSEMQMGVNFQRKIYLAIPVTTAICYCTPMSTMVHKSAGDVVFIPVSYQIVPVTFESQRQLQNGIKVMQWLMHRRDWCLSISNSPYAFIIWWTEIICIYFPLSCQRKLPLFKFCIQINAVYSICQIRVAYVKLNEKSGFQGSHVNPIFHLRI